MRPLAHSFAVAAALAALPIGLSALALRPRWRVGLKERLGGLPVCEPGAIWLHAASAGEARAAVRLQTALRAAHREVFMTTMTLAGRDVLRRQLSDLPAALAPLDHPWCVERALRRIQPALLALVETELWPNWIAAVARRALPVVIVSGRLSSRSFSRLRRLGPLIRPTLERIEAVGARSQRDAERFVSLGVPAGRVSVTGDLKLEPPPVPAPDPALVQALAGVACFVAGSTHAGEELAALRAVEACERAGFGLALLVAPRDLERLDRVERDLRGSGRRVVRRSRVAGEKILAGDVLLLDSMGELPSTYGLAVAAFVGGTLVPVGGHNLLEPAFAGCPVLFGPQLAHVEEAAEALISGGCGECVMTAAALAAALLNRCKAQADPAGRVQRIAVNFDPTRGSVERNAALIERVHRARGGT